MLITLTNCSKTKEHVLSKEEELLGRSGWNSQVAGETFEILDNADIVFPMVKDDKAKKSSWAMEPYLLVESKGRQVRKEAYQALYGVYEQ